MGCMKLGASFHSTPEEGSEIYCPFLFWSRSHIVNTPSQLRNLYDIWYLIGVNFQDERCTSKTVINCTAAFYNKNLLLDLISYTNCQEEDDWSDEDKQSHTSGASKSSLTAPSGGRKSPSPAPSANSLFAEEPEDDLFASTKSAAKPTDR